MKTSDLAENLFREAQRRLKTARTAFKEKAHAYTVRQSQECVELSLKGALRLVMVEYPKKHDVSNVLELEAGRFPAWFREAIPRMAKASAALAEKRSLAMYGDEQAGLAPASLFNEQDSHAALESAEFVFKNLSKLLREWRQPPTPA